MNQPLAVDPVTLEVLRHRLWMINDEQGRTAAQISGSPVVYESKDFNASLLTPDGRSIFVGVYTTRISLCLEAAARWVMEHYRLSPGYRDGDAFVTNDPWAGAAHQNDILMVAPIFWREQLVAWAGIAMHEVDVGGPNPGSFTVGAQNVFGEGPLIAPVKLVEGGKIREDIEAWMVRNTRTPELNALDLRARIAAINRTRQRIGEAIEEYGVETVLAVEERILDLAGEAFLRRIRELPDGTWRDEGFIDHDGNTNRYYRIAVELTKSGDRLSFDFNGTDAQADGSINCTRVGLESGVMSAILPMLCFDISWSPGAIRPLIDIHSQEGTVNNARHPAGVSMATVAATFATQHVAAGAIAKMLACSQLTEEIQANWCPAWQGMTLNGVRQGGARFTAVLLDQAGGGGARSFDDGPDTSGLPGSPAQGIANVETYEKAYPILYIYRKQSADTGGAGYTRGGVGLESLMIPHRAEGALDLTVLTHGASQPEARGLYGGYPSSIQARILFHGSNLREEFAKGRILGALDEVGCERVEVLAAKQRTQFLDHDALLVVSAGGGGYGDPLERDPQRVLNDIRLGLVSPERARELYGVDLEHPQSDALRQKLRAHRLEEGAVVHALNADKPFEPGGPKVGRALVVGLSEGESVFACAGCHYVYGPTGADPKSRALMRERSIAEMSPWNRYGATEDFVVRQFYCPRCARMMGVEMRLRTDPILADTVLAPGS